MAGIKLAEPWLPEVYELVTGDTELLHQCREEDERIQNAYLKNMEAQEEDFSGLCFSRVKFENCSFEGCNFEKAEFSDVMFVSCNFSNCLFRDSFLRRVSFQRSKGTGARMTESSLKDVSIMECSMQYLNLDDSKLESFRVEDSDLEMVISRSAGAKALRSVRSVFRMPAFLRLRLREWILPPATSRGWCFPMSVLRCGVRSWIYIRRRNWRSGWG